MVEDPNTGMTVGLSFPEGALTEDTEVTLVIHGTKQAGVITKCHINGISILPKTLLFQEKVSIDVYNPPVVVTREMLLYRVVSTQFIMPLGSHEQHLEENWISGTIYAGGTFSTGTPTATEIASQCRKLAAYNPARPLAYAGEESDTPVSLPEKMNNMYEFYACGGPFAGPPDEYLPSPICTTADDEECMRWQKALTKIEAHMTWVEQYIYTKNPEAEQAERRAAEDDLQEAIDGYLKKASPANKCGSYIKAAAKYTESATLLGMNIRDESPIAQQFNKLVDECSFVFAVETRFWINQPKEKRKDGSSYEEKLNNYTTIKCYTPWNEFQATGTQKVRGEGERSITWDKHWVGDEKEDHMTVTSAWKVEKIEGAISQYVDDHGEQTMLANISIYWKETTSTRIWGKNPHGPYDVSGTETKTSVEHTSYNLENGYSENIGNESSGHSLRVYILKSPGDGRDDPDDCF
ncbi:MAG: hypothetical protein U5L72_05545 [Bacteroidales bacterium]|nr:hypothetical protein [Bacteroidales bacterium]